MMAPQEPRATTADEDSDSTPQEEQDGPTIPTASSTDDSCFGAEEPPTADDDDPGYVSFSALMEQFPLSQRQIPLLENNNNPHNDNDRYPQDPRRYLVLAVFCLCNMIPSAMWITFAPISDAVQIYYHISEVYVDWLSMIYMLLFGPGTLLAEMAIRRHGLYASVAGAAVVTAVGGFLRWISVYLYATPGVSYATLLAGQALVALVQPVYANTPARVSAAWFAQTSTPIGVCIFTTLIGSVVGQSISPLYVKENDGTHLGAILAWQALFAALCAIATVAWFQAEPEHPPSAAEAVRRRQQQQQQMQSQAVATPPQQRHRRAMTDTSLTAALLPSANRDLPADIPEEEPLAMAISSNSQSDLHSQVLTPTTPSSSHSSLWNDWYTLLSDREFVILLYPFSVGYAVNNAALTLLQPWIATAGYAGDEVSGLCGSMMMIGGVVGTLLVAPWLDRTRDYNRAIKWGFGLSFLATAWGVLVLRPGTSIGTLAVAFTAMGMTQMPLQTIAFDASAAHMYPMNEELSSAALQLFGQYGGIGMIYAAGKMMQDQPNHWGVTAPVNAWMLGLLATCAAAGLLYQGEDKRAAVQDTSTTNDGGADRNTNNSSGLDVP